MNHLISVDACDRHLLDEFTWCDSGHGYAKAWDGNLKKFVYLHRLVMGSPDCVVDHRDGNKLNNVRSNLRLASKSENALNGGKRKCTADHGMVSRHRGVAWNAARGRWTASFRGKYLGIFDDEDAAALKYNEAAKSHGTDFVRMNFVEVKS